MKRGAKIAVMLILALVLQGVPNMLPHQPQVIVENVTGQESPPGEGKEIAMPQPGSMGLVQAYAAPTTPGAIDTPPANTDTPTPDPGTPTPDPTGTPVVTVTPPPVLTPAPGVTWGEVKFYFIGGEAGTEPRDEITIPNNNRTHTVYVGCSLGYITSDMKITKWDSADEKIFTVEPRKGSDNHLSFELDVKGIGTAKLHAEIEVKVGDQTYTYQAYCDIRVPLKLKASEDENNINPKLPDPNDPSASYGMIDKVVYNETSEKKTIQLTTPEDNKDRSHYLPMFEFINYKTGVNSLSEGPGRDLLDIATTDNFAPYVVDIEKTDPDVATVDEFGYITAVGAGCTEVTFKTLDGKDAKTITIIVAPKVKVKDGGGIYGKFTNNLNYDMSAISGSAVSLTLETNAKTADKIRWAFYLKTWTNENNRFELIEKEPYSKDTDYMHIDVSTNDGSITLTNLKAGIYYLVGSQKAYEQKNVNIKKVFIKVVVPIGISERRLIMNVGDTYDILLNANILDKSMFDAFVAQPDSRDPSKPDINQLSDVAEYSSGILTALRKGDAFLILKYKGTDNPDKDIYGDSSLIGTAYKAQYTIPITVIDGLSLNMTTATMPVGGTLQLHALTSNRSIPLVWTSSDETILTVDEDGLVTALKEGKATITVSQTIDNVTKTATCTITVIGAITKIELDPASKQIKIGDLLTINAKITPKTNGASLKWITSDPATVSLEQEGDLTSTVKGLREGIAVITAINQENVVVGSCMITVVGDHSIKKLTLSQTNVTTSLAEKTLPLYATITPPDAENEPIVWSSSDNTIATVDQKGLVTLRKSGTVTIICTAKNDASLAASCRITILQAVTGIKLDQSNITMNVGETFRLTYVLTPANASNVAVTWISTNNAVASVDKNGQVSAKGVGQASILLKTTDGGYIATCLVNVNRVATAVRLDATALTLNVGDSYTFETTITPADSTDKTLIWEISDKGVVAVSNKGKVIAKKIGVSVVMAKTKSGSTAYCTVTVQQGVTGVKLDSHEEELFIGDEWELNAVVSPKNATNQEVKWTSSERSVASVDKEGRVKALKEGVTIITCTTVDGGYVDYCAVQVSKNIVESEELKIDPESCQIGVGKTMKLTPIFTPEDTTDKSVKWESSNTKIVTVDKKGRIKGIKPGNAVITCTAQDGGGAQGTCEVEVCQLITEITLDNSYLSMVVGDVATIVPTIRPKEATYGVVWESEDPTIAVVDKQSGRVTALKAGDTQIKAKAEDSSGVEAICVVHVRNPVAITNIQVSESEVVMVPGEEKTVSFTILPAGYTDKYVWSSDNPVVASVNRTTGLITARALGTANITILADSGRTASVKIYVVGLSKTSLTLERYTSTLISLEVYGASKADLDVRWYSDNERIAQVQNGRITGKALGTTYVYAVVNGRRLACRVTVEKIRR